MVARFVSGRSIKGAVNYNEEKVRAGKAELIHAEKYLDDPGNLSFMNRLSRLQDLAALNERTKTNCVHVSLNFSPGELISDTKMIRIAKDYMKGIGFGKQPFLVYRHHDAAHGHCHIVSTNVIAHNKKISLHNLVPNFSEPTRKAIEKKYGLIQAEGRGKETQPMLSAVDLERAVYGKSETKKAISNIVRTVVRDYQFTSLAELNAVLKDYNVVADRGEPDSPMYKKRGLVYCLLGKEGEKIGVPIKASSIYTRPTIAELEKKFDKNLHARKNYGQPLKHVIDKTLPLAKDRATFQLLLAKENIKVLFRENAERVYGITFVDHRSKVVFNGSDLGKAYSASGIFDRLGKAQVSEAGISAAHKRLNDQIMAIDYSKGIASALGQLYSRGLRLQTGDEEQAGVLFIGGKRGNYMPVPPQTGAYLRTNGVTPSFINRLNHWIDHSKALPTPAIFISRGFLSFINTMLKKEQADQPFAMQPPKKKKRRRNL